MDECKECGMLVDVNEYHPYAACLMFKACHDNSIVQANLDAVRAYGYQAHIEQRPNVKLSAALLNDKWPKVAIDPAPKDSWAVEHSFEQKEQPYWRDTSRRSQDNLQSLACCVLDAVKEVWAAHYSHEREGWCVYHRRGLSGFEFVSGPYPSEVTAEHEAKRRAEESSLQNSAIRKDSIIE
jgi:hypothetical protein